MILLLAGYLVVVLLVAGIYTDLLEQKEKELQRQKRQVAGLEYLKALDDTRLRIVHYKELFARDGNSADKKELDRSVGRLLETQKITQPALQAKLSHLKKHNYPTELLEEILDPIALEGFKAVGTYDIHFYEDKESYFFSILSTYFIPELSYDLAYLKSMLPADTNDSLTQNNREMFTWHIAPVEKSLVEIEHLVRILSAEGKYTELTYLVAEMKKTFALLRPSEDFSTASVDIYKKLIDTMQQLSQKLEWRVDSHFNNLFEIEESTLHYAVRLYKGEFIFLLLLLSVLFFYLFRSLRLNHTKDAELYKRQKELELFNSSLQGKIHDEVKKNRDKDEMLFNQSRLAQMGEMINMMAYQWRQPLSGISAASMSIELKTQLDQCDKEGVIRQTANISSFVKHISDTIDDFRNFFRSGRKREHITFPQIVSDVLKIIEPQLRYESIAVTEQYGDRGTFENLPGELRQVVLNLIKHIQHTLAEQKVHNPAITIRSYESPEEHILDISGNAVNINESSIRQLFDPYTPSPGESRSSAMGLHISRSIVEKFCNGTLEAANPDHTILFRIRLNKEPKAKQ